MHGSAWHVLLHQLTYQTLLYTYLCTVQVALLPVRLRLDQDVLSYLMAFGSAVLTPHTTAALELLSQLQVGTGTHTHGHALPFLLGIALLFYTRSGLTSAGLWALQAV